MSTCAVFTEVRSYGGKTTPLTLKLATFPALVPGMYFTYMPYEATKIKEITYNFDLDHFHVLLDPIDLRNYNEEKVLEIFWKWDKVI